MRKLFNLNVVKGVHVFQLTEQIQYTSNLGAFGEMVDSL